MTIFFLVVGLEIKYELLHGALNSLPKALLPGIAALGGMIIPALFYLGFNYHSGLMLRGWAIPVATDIAFTLAVLSLLGSKVTPALKTFLMALAILDDLIAIIIIAIFYTAHIAVIFLALALLCAALLFLLNRCGVMRLLPYCAGGLLLWFCLLKSGIHPTLAGVALAMLVPFSSNKKSPVNLLLSPLHRLKQRLHPWVALGILPLFAFANAGISFLHLNLATASLHLSLIFGALCGLFFGKQLGVFGACRLAVKLRWAALPDRVRWPELYAVAVICGVGFTISIFISALAFGAQPAAYLNSAKIGVLSGSLLSGLAGYLLLLIIYRRRKRKNAIVK
jgi:NhaA family Na+:H+ antiporter